MSRVFFINPPSPDGYIYIRDVNRHGRRSFISTPDMRKAQIASLSYRTLEILPKFSLLEIGLETGRHHQIRVQMADIGHPVLGDRKYGSLYSLPNRNIALLARSLMLIHPTRSEKIRIESPIPNDWPWPPHNLIPTS